MNLLHLRIERRFRLPIWDATMKNRAIDFWSRRGVKFSETGERHLSGRRGNLAGNLISFDMTKLMANLTVAISPDAAPDAGLHCVLTVNRFGQSITEWNRAWWDLEMETFESFLLRGDEQEARWQEFRARYKKGAVIWTATLGTAGRTIDPADKP